MIGDRAALARGGGFRTRATGILRTVAGAFAPSSRVEVGRVLPHVAGIVSSPACQEAAGQRFVARQRPVELRRAPESSRRIFVVSQLDGRPSWEPQPTPLTPSRGTRARSSARRLRLGSGTSGHCGLVFKWRPSARACALQPGHRQQASRMRSRYPQGARRLTRRPGAARAVVMQHKPSDPFSSRSRVLSATPCGQGPGMGRDVHASISAGGGTS